MTTGARQRDLPALFSMVDNGQEDLGKTRGGTTGPGCTGAHLQHCAFAHLASDFLINRRRRVRVRPRASVRYQLKGRWRHHVAVKVSHQPKVVLRQADPARLLKGVPLAKGRENLPVDLGSTRPSRDLT